MKEYKVIIEEVSGERQIEEILNGLAEDGWRVNSVTFLGITISGKTNLPIVMIIMEREKLREEVIINKEEEALALI